MKLLPKFTLGDLVENARTNTVATVTAMLPWGYRLRNGRGHTAYWVARNCVPCDQDRYDRLQVLDLIAHAAGRPIRTIGMEETPAAVRLGPENPGRVIMFVAALEKLCDITLPFGSISRRRSVAAIVELVLKAQARRSKRIA